MRRDDARLRGNLPPAVARLLDWMFAPVATQATASEPTSRDRRPAGQGAGELWSEHARGALFAPSAEPSRDAPVIPMPRSSGATARWRPVGLFDGIAARRRHSLAGLLGPHLGEGLERAGEAGRQTLEFLSPAADVPGMLAGSQQLSRGLREGDLLGATAGGLDLLGATLAMALPGTFAQYKAGTKAARDLVLGLLDPAEDMAAASKRVGYNPKPLPQRPFHDDYPQMAGGGQQGRLATSIDGAELDAPLVAGRRVSGGNDEGLRAEDVLAATGQLVHDTAPASRRELGRDVGQYKREYDAAGNERRRILYRKDLKEAEIPRVIAHELGHAIDEMAGRIDHTGLTDELNQVYHDLATGQQGRTRHRTLPKHLGYNKTQVPRELMAEAIRAYMVDPNYLKTVAPKTAARIRRYVNTNPRLKHVIQFNELAALLGAGLLGDIGFRRDSGT